MSKSEEYYQKMKEKKLKKDFEKKEKQYLRRLNGNKIRNTK